MMVQMTLVGAMFGQYVHFMRFAPAVDEVRAKTTACGKADKGANDSLFGRGRYAA